MVLCVRIRENDKITPWSPCPLNGQLEIIGVSDYCKGASIYPMLVSGMSPMLQHRNPITGWPAIYFRERKYQRRSVVTGDHMCLDIAETGCVTRVETDR
jgi:hypothetical protein